MWDKVWTQYFIAVAVIFSILAIIYASIPEPTTVTPFMMFDQPSTYELEEDAPTGFTGWVTGPAPAQSFARSDDPYRYYGRGSGRFTDYRDDGDRPYLFRSGDCKSYYTDTLHPLYGECREETAIDENPHQIRRCDKFCTFDFDEKFDLCEANYADGTRELGQCVDHYISKESNYDSICSRECVV
jgi:hypothetical protein|tara:strand:+ start:898 stop:1452 length:555 start_codon:yes stop_codon:yes gene_type:complete